MLVQIGSSPQVRFHHLDFIGSHPPSPQFLPSDSLHFEATQPYCTQPPMIHQNSSPKPPRKHQSKLAPPKKTLADNFGFFFSTPFPPWWKGSTSIDPKVFWLPPDSPTLARLWGGNGHELPGGPGVAGPGCSESGFSKMLQLLQFFFSDSTR